MRKSARQSFNQTAAEQLSMEIDKMHPMYKHKKAMQTFADKVVKINNDPSYNRFRRLVDSMNVSPHMRNNSKNIRKKLGATKKMETYIKNIKVT